MNSLKRVTSNWIELLNKCYQTLNTTHYKLHTTHYTLHTTHYTLHTTHYTLHRGLRTEDRGQITEDFKLIWSLSFNHGLSFGNEVEIVLVKLQTVNVSFIVWIWTLQTVLFLLELRLKGEIILFHCTQRNWYESWCMIQGTDSLNLYVLSLKFIQNTYSFPLDYKSTSCKVNLVVWQLFRGFPPKLASLFKLLSSPRLTSGSFFIHYTFI